MSRFCVFCDHPGSQRHHVTGRSASRQYLDIALTVFACGACNIADFKAWRAAGLDGIEDPSLARLRRLAFFAARLGGQERPIALPPGFWRALAKCLSVVADDVEGR
jgi:hypothetical protein